MSYKKYPSEGDSEFMKFAVSSQDKAKRIEDAAPLMLEALQLHEKIYQLGLLNGAHLLAKVAELRTRAIAAATGMPSA